MILLEPLAKPLGRKLARTVTRKAERLGDWTAEQRIAKGIEDEGKGALRDAMLLVADAQLGNERPDRIQDGIEGIAVAGEDHPGGKCPGALAVEYVEDLVDDVAGIGLTGARTRDCVHDSCRDGIANGAGKLALQASGRTEMVEQVRMRSADLCSDGLERDRLRAVREEKPARSFDREGAALFGA